MSLPDGNSHMESHCGLGLTAVSFVWVLQKLSVITQVLQTIVYFLQPLLYHTDPDIWGPRYG